MIACLLALVVASSDEAPSLRALCIRADAVVLATPTDPVVPVRFKVTEVLQGRDVRVGEELIPGLREADVKSFDEVDVGGDEKPRSRQSENALLFFKEGKLLGLRLLTHDGRVMGLNGRGKVTLREAGWPGLIWRVRSDLKTVQQLRGYRALGRADRKTAALVGWIERNRVSLVSRPSGSDEFPTGWEEWNLGVFDWIIETENHACAWRAVRLYAELHGELFQPRQAVFGSPAGREFLWERARDKETLGGDRARALLLLSTSQMLWPGLTREEQEQRIDAVAELLGDEEAPVRLAAVTALGRMSMPEAPAHAGRKTTRAREALATAYRTASGAMRHELAWLLVQMGARENADNPAGVVAILREVAFQDGELKFWLHLRTPGTKVQERPTLVLERLSSTGMVAETKRTQLEVEFLPRPWKEGWAGEGPLPVRVPLDGLQTGWVYRVRVEGSLGQESMKETWQSEPWTFLVPGRPGGTYRRR